MVKNEKFTKINKQMASLIVLPNNALLEVLEKSSNLNLESLYRISSSNFRSLVSNEVVKRYKKFKYKVDSLLDNINPSKVESMLYDLCHCDDSLRRKCRCLCTDKECHGRDIGTIVAFKIGKKIHREHGPAVIGLDVNGNKEYEEWYLNNEVRRENGPAVVTWYENGNKNLEQWYFNDKIHKEDGPASIKWYEDGNKMFEEWYKDGKVHKEDGPAEVEWYENGNKKHEKWFIKGELYKKDGPAVTKWHSDGKQCNCC